MAKLKIGALLFLTAWLISIGSTQAGPILIDELMYHPSSENTKEEYVELLNASTNAVNLAGWRFTAGVRFVFPDVTVPPGGYLVVAADLAVFAQKYPGVTNVVGNWDGILSNSGQPLALVDAEGKAADNVRYADDGDWAQRVKDVADYGHRGWVWHSLADGRGMSLELVNTRLSNKYGQNWLASSVTNGTPGRANSVASTNIAPLIVDVSQFPLIPKSTQSVTLTARILDEATNGISVTLHHQIDGAAGFTATAMTDEGLQGDGTAGDGVYGVMLPAHTNKTVVEFYVEARDAEGHIRTWPAPALVDGTLSQTANALYQVDDTVAADSAPLYRMILTAAAAAELKQINRNSPPYLTSDQTRSHAQFNATFLSADGTGSEVRYTVGVRNRGNGSRTKTPQGYRVNFQNAQMWKGAAAINLNSQYTHAQVAGSAVYRRAGIPTQESRPVHLRVNGDDLSTVGSPSFGYYACNEVVNSQFAGQHFPADSSGNLYRGIRLQAPGANLSYLGANADPYRVNYFKQSNTSEDNWADLSELTRVIDQTPDATYTQEIRRVANVEEWMMYFAAETLVVNMETDLGNGNNGDGEGDDYFLYIGVNDPRANVVPYDLDTIMDQGDTRGDVQAGLFRAGANARISRFLKWPEFAPLYFRELLHQIDTIFAPETLDPLLDQTIGDFTPKTNVEAMKSFMAARCAYVRTQIPLACSVSGTNFVRSTTATAALTGFANIIETKSVNVKGAAVAWSAWEGKWTAASVDLEPGVNRILVQAFDAAGLEIDRTTVDVWYDKGAMTTIAGGTLSGSNYWSAASGPYNVTASLTIASGATLLIEPDASVYLGSGVNLTVANGGRLLAEGNATAPIRLTRTPGSTSTWGGIVINGGAGSPETRLRYVHIEFNGSTAIHSSGATVLLDHLTFGTTDHQYVSLDDSSFVLSDCVFPTPTGGFEPVHGTGGIKSGGRGIFLRNFFGAPNGYNDVVDFTGGNRPGLIVQFIDNVFTGSGDDVLDLDGTDAWIEGNIFLHVHKNGSPDSSSAVSGGDDSGNTSEVTIIGNLFYDCDQAAMAKQGNFFTLINNTIVHQTKQGGLDTDAAVICLADAGTAEGAGMYLEGNIIYDAEKLVRNQTAALVTFTNNLMALPWNGPGGGNSPADPMLKHIPQLSETVFTSWEQAQVMRDWFSLRSGSPGSGTGPNGQDLGGNIRLGASISGAPTGTHNQTAATLSVGVMRTGNGILPAGWPSGSGYTHYKWRLDSGLWSTETVITSPILLSGLADGPHYVEVVGKRDSGWYQDDPVFGVDALVSRSETWILDTSYVPPTPKPDVRINEILARNVSAVEHGGAYPDMVELFNAGGLDADLSGLSLAADITNSPLFVFPPGTTLPAGQYLVLYGGNDTNVAGLNLGFKLNQDGESLYLFDKFERGSVLLDSVVFGRQLSDLSIGRTTGGEWALAVPTLGAANIFQPTGSAMGLKINEWGADGRAVFVDDFIELYNPTSFPVELGGLYLIDQPAPVPGMAALPPLSFIEGRSFAVFIADGQPLNRANHLDFKLRPEQGAIGLFAPDLTPIDVVLYGPQTTDISEGRSPNGADAFAFFTQPTPGAGNPGSVSNTNVTTQVINLIAMTNVWKYYQSGALSNAWMAPDFTGDAAWPSGAALLYVETSALPAPKNTPLTLGKTAYYFRTHFQVNTNLTGATLNLYTIIDDGAVFYLNGQEFQRLHMSPGTVTYDTHASDHESELEGPFTVSLTNLVAGDNVMAVELHQVNATSSDIVLGLSLTAELYQTNSVDQGSAAVQINEVLAINTTWTNADGTVSDWVELFNPASKTADLTDMSLTDDVGVPRKWIFPTNSTIPPGGYLVIPCSGTATNTLQNTGFGLNAGGDAVYLFAAPTNGGALLDSVIFGLQIPDLSIGRAGPTHTWTLTQPTPGATNVAVALGSPANLKINEWMANPASGDDWFELYNPGLLPVELSNLSLTDDLNRPAQYIIPALSFIGTSSNAFQTFDADGNPGKGANHVNFKLSASGETIGLFTVDELVIDQVIFGPQLVGIAQGRYPDGTTAIVSLPMPTPGAPNLTTALIVIQEIHAMAEGTVELSWATEIGGVYRILIKEKLTDPLWTALPEMTAPGAILTFTNASVLPQGFFTIERIR